MESWALRKPREPLLKSSYVTARRGVVKQNQVWKKSA
jgi:hypothetical protein